MQEQYVQMDMFAIEEATPKAAERRRRIHKEEEPERPVTQRRIDFSRFDFTRDEVRQSLARAANIILEMQQARRKPGGV
jgi:hypothetical protein